MGSLCRSESIIILLPDLHNKQRKHSPVTDFLKMEMRSAFYFEQGKICFFFALSELDSKDSKKCS